MPSQTSLAFLTEMSERLPTGLDAVVAKWVSSLPTPNVVATFGGQLGSKIGGLFVGLVTEGVMTAPETVTSVLIPVWKVLLSQLTPLLLSSPSLSLPPEATLVRALETTSTIFSHLVGEHEARSPDLSTSPLAFLSRQRASSRRAALYTQAVLPDIGRSLSLLVLQQEVLLAVGQIDKARETGAVVIHVNNLPAFQMAVARDPQALAVAMLDSAVVSAIPGISTYRPKLLAALLIALKDSSTGACSGFRCRFVTQHADQTVSHLQPLLQVSSRQRTGTCSYLA